MKKSKTINQLLITLVCATMASTNTVAMFRWCRGPRISPARTRYRYTELHQAAEENRLDDARRLLVGGANVNVKATEADYQITPLYCAAARGHIQMMQLLLQHGAQQERPYGCVLDTPLYTAVNNGHFEATKILLQHLKDTQVVSPYLYEKSLRCAIASGHAAITELLLEHGATAPNALFAAIYHKHPAVIDVLLKRKPPTENEYGRDFFFPSDDFDPSPGIPGHIVWPEQNRTTYFGSPIRPLPLALTQRNMEITRQLLIGNADPEAECLELQSDPCKRFYQRPLFHAAQSAFVDATRALLAAGASMQEGTHTCCLGSR